MLHAAAAACFLLLLLLLLLLLRCLLIAPHFKILTKNSVLVIRVASRNSK
jgi:hypothetical protein